MELTAEEVDTISEVRDLVGDLEDAAAENPDGPLNEANLVLLYEQLDALHQALSLAVAQKDAMQGVDLGGE